jgi:SpoVK/Ycf46/Vps4 family AAA+-type ATPase
MQKAFADRGMPNAKRSMHMVFTGNPGTAKTTVARLFAQILKDNKILSVGNIIECGRSDLVGKYVGWTAVQVKQLFQKAQGSVLFIDEAYSLCDDRNGLFGDEAINTIVQEMENQREDMVVIFAGYPKEMKDFIDRNPGLRSRISFYVDFKDYSPSELYDITKHIAGNNGYKMADDTYEKLIPIFEASVGTTNHGNGRYARNLVEKAQLAQALRLSKCDLSALTGDELLTLKAEDFSNFNIGISDNENQPACRIGFKVG